MCLRERKYEFYWKQQYILLLISGGCSPPSWKYFTPLPSATAPASLLCISPSSFYIVQAFTYPPPPPRCCWVRNLPVSPSLFMKEAIALPRSQRSIYWQCGWEMPHLHVYVLWPVIKKTSSLQHRCSNFSCCLHRLLLPSFLKRHVSFSPPAALSHSVHALGILFYC